MICGSEFPRKVVQGTHWVFARLVEGMKREEADSSVLGRICCCGRSLNCCPDQLARALEERIRMDLL